MEPEEIDFVGESSETDDEGDDICHEDVSKEIKEEDD